MPEINVATQYQKGDFVIYVPLGILTRIEGYVWARSYGDEPPSFVGFQLECGISVDEKQVRRATLAEVHRIDPALKGDA